jgi:hypothetical protein
MMRQTVPVLGPRTKIKYSIAICKHWRKADWIGFVAAAVVRWTDEATIIEVQSANYLDRTHGRLHANQQIPRGLPGSRWFNISWSSER